MRVAVVLHLQFVTLFFPLNLSFCSAPKLSGRSDKLSFHNSHLFHFADRFFLPFDKVFFPAAAAFYGIYWLFLATDNAFYALNGLFFEENRLFSSADFAFWRPCALKNRLKTTVYAENTKKTTEHT